MPRKRTGGLKILSRNKLVDKKNELNHLYPLSMTLQQVRFFTIYLSQIKRKDESTRLVRFPLEDFQKVMELENITLSNIKKAVDGLLQNIMHTYDERGGFRAFQMFKECEVTADDRGEWYVEIDAHDRALPLFFGYQNRFFRYKMWNALRLRSTNQVRMYEIVKEQQWQSETHPIPLDELKLRLGLLPDEYKEYWLFKRKVLDVCQQAIIEKTDVKYKYEPVRKGRGGKVTAIVFYDIEENKDYVDQYVIEEYTTLPDEFATKPPPKSPYKPKSERDKFGAPTKNQIDEMIIFRQKMEMECPREKSCGSCESWFACYKGKSLFTEGAEQ